MAFDAALAGRIRQLLGGRPGITERKMFGGLALLLNGHMVCGVVEQDLVLRLGEAGVAHALTRPHVRPMDFTGTPLKSMVYVGPGGTKTRRQLETWVERALGFARTLPPKD